MSLTGPMITDLCAEVFAGNVAAGWRTDLMTGESLIGKRNFGELLMLVVTEISEAGDGLVSGDIPDDKLPHRPMFEVELADAAIRVFDIGGGFGLRLGDAFSALQSRMYRVTESENRVRELDLFDLTQRVAAAMEGHRKGADCKWLSGYKVVEVELAALLLGICEIADAYCLDLLGAIAEKRAFNANRADHKPENRRLAGGKVC